MSMLVEVAIKGFFVFAAAGIAGVALRRRAAATRHLAWSIAFVCVLALPALVALGPRHFVAVAEGSVLAPLAAPIAYGPDPDEASRRAGDERSRGTGEDAFRGGGDGRISGAPETGPSMKELTSAPGASFPRPSPSHFGPSPVTGAAREPDIAAPAAALVQAPRPVLVGWLAGALLVLAALLVERVRLFLVCRRARRCEAGPIVEVMEQVSVASGLRRAPRMLIGDADAMPMTWGTVRPFVLLPADAEDWSPARLETVLRHEIAHVRRRDDLMQLVAVTTAALHWFDPLAWWALRRLRREREHACDDAVLRGGTRPSRYAEELLDIAGRYRVAPTTAMASQPMASSTPLHRRLVAVLADSRHREPLSRPVVLVAVVVAALVTVPVGGFALATAPVSGVEQQPPVTRGESVRSAAGPTVPEATSSGGNDALEGATVPTTVGSAPAPAQATGSECWSPGVDRSFRSLTDSDSELRVIEWDSDNCRAEVRLEGELEFDAGFDRVTGISPGGRLVIRHEEGGTSRRLVVTAAADGAETWSWSVDGRELEFDAGARAWLDGLMPAILRSSGIAAEERTAAIFRRSGAEGVFREIALINSTSATSRYLIALAEQPGIGQDDLVRILDIARDMDSNSSKSRVLAEVGSRHKDEILSGDLEAAYWAAVDSIDSNSTTTNLLERLIDGEPQSSPMVTRALQVAAAKIDSNSTLASFLKHLHRAYPDILTSGPQSRLFWETSRRIDSNSTLRDFLLDVSSGARVDATIVPLVLETARERISSDSTMADLLLSLDRRYPGIGESGPMADDFWRTVETLNSSSTLKSLLLEIAAGQGQGSPLLDRVLAVAARRIDSSSQTSDFLLSFARRHPEAASGRLRQQVLDGANGIDSRSTRERTLRALGDLGIR